MPIQKWTMMFVPNKGLFYNGGMYREGPDGAVLNISRITLYPTREAAVEAKSRVMERDGDLYGRGHLVIMPVDVQEGGGSDGRIKRSDDYPRGGEVSEAIS